MKSYEETAKQIINAVGGTKNIIGLTHCMTRLRFELANNSKLDEKSMKDIPKVMGVVNLKDQVQVVIGSEVNDVYQALAKLGVGVEDATIEKDEKGSLFNQIISVITGCVAPMIPALTAGGMIKAIMSIIALISPDVAVNSTWKILDFVSDAPFYFMPIIIAASASKKFHVNQTMAIVIAGILLHPNFTQMVNSGEEIAFLRLPVKAVTYSSTIIPIILMVWIMSYIEKYILSHTPKILKVVLDPTIEVLLAAPLALVVVGPLGNYVGEGFGWIINILQGQFGFVAIAIIAASYPFLVMFGMHHVLTPIMLNTLATTGHEALVLVAASCSNLAQGGAALSVAIRAKNSKTKQLAAATGISATIGVTEPALYGVNLKLKKPMIGACIGAGIGGLIGGITGVTYYIIPSNVFSGIAALIGEKGARNIVWGCASILIAFIISFVIGLIIGVDEENEDKVEDLRDKKQLNEENRSSQMVRRQRIMSPIKGKAISLDDVNDKMFSEKLLGQGIAILPSEGKVLSPVDGVIEYVAETGHAMAIKTEAGLEILIHLGIDTVKENGEGFDCKIKSGDKVNVGDTLVLFELDKLKQKKYDMSCMVVITNSSEYLEILTTDEKNIDFGDNLMTVL